MPFVAFLFAVAFGFIWDLIISFFVLLIFNAIGIPALDALSFWQIFGLLVVVGLATTKISANSN